MPPSWSARRLSALLAAAASAACCAGCGFDGLGSGTTSSSSPTEPSTPTSGGPPATGDPNGDGGPMGTAVCEDRVLSFDGVDDVVGASPADALNLPGDFTIEAWVKPAATDPEMDLLSHASAADSSGWVLRIRAGHVEAEVYGRTFSFFNVAANTTAGGAGAAYVVADKWAFVAATMQNGTLRVYYDGALKDSSGPPFSFARSNFGGVLDLGRAAANASHPYKGELDDVRLSKVARYTGDTSTVPTVALEVDVDTVALWHFDEPNNIFLNDETGAHGALMAKDMTAPTRTTAPCPASR